jgi:hypothetical protein
MKIKSVALKLVMVGLILVSPAAQVCAAELGPNVPSKSGVPSKVSVPGPVNGLCPSNFPCASGA